MNKLAGTNGQPGEVGETGESLKAGDSNGSGAARAVQGVVALSTANRAQDGCSHCFGAIDQDGTREALRCATCGRLCHKSCWSTVGRCTRHGCRSATATRVELVGAPIRRAAARRIGPADGRVRSPAVLRTIAIGCIAAAIGAALGAAGRAHQIGELRAKLDRRGEALASAAANTAKDTASRTETINKLREEVRTRDKELARVKEDARAFGMVALPLILVEPGPARDQADHLFLKGFSGANAPDRPPQEYWTYVAEVTKQDARLSDPSFRAAAANAMAMPASDVNATVAFASTVVRAARLQKFDVYLKPLIQRQK